CRFLSHVHKRPSLRVGSRLIDGAFARIRLVVRIASESTSAECAIYSMKTAPLIRRFAAPSPRFAGRKISVSDLRHDGSAPHPPLRGTFSPLRGAKDLNEQTYTTIARHDSRRRPLHTIRHGP